MNSVNHWRFLRRRSALVLVLTGSVHLLGGCAGGSDFTFTDSNQAEIGAAEIASSDITSSEDTSSENTVPDPEVVVRVITSKSVELPDLETPGDLPLPAASETIFSRHVMAGGADDDVAEIPWQASTTLVAHAVVEEVVAHAGPRSSEIVATFANPNRHGGPLVFQSLTSPESELIDSGWIPVLLPIRPNGTIGWIETSSVELTRNPFRIEVDVDDFTLTVFRHNDVHFLTKVGIGDGDTPTPHGSFFLTDLLRPTDPTGVYGPYAYGLSGYSEMLRSFSGGPGVIGIHGTNQPEAIGTRVSHGCIRVDNEAISELATFLPLGTPVVVGNDPTVPTGLSARTR